MALLFTFHFSLLYQALECPEQFVEHTECIAVGAEVLADLQVLEVRAERAVVLTGDRDVLAVEESRVALSGPGQRLYEGVVLVVIEILALDVTAQDACVAFY